MSDSTTNRPAGGHMQFRALGPLEVVRDDEAVDLGPLKQRSLLALLLIHANEVVSTDRIVEELWGPEAEGKENALWVYVSRLRSALEPDRVERGESNVLLRRDPGYILVVEEEHYDVRNFEHLLGQGREAMETDPEAAASLIAEALELWRGNPFDDFRYEPFAQTEIMRLEDARISAIENRLEADLACGRSGELVSELEVLREQYPLRERLVAHLMVALYRSGRPADALRAFGRFRQETADELGIEPSPELRRLEEQILLHDEDLQRIPRTREPSATTRSEAANPFKGLLPFVESDSKSFFGRDALVAEMLRLIGGGQRLLAVVGSSGSGKSSVVRAGLIPALSKGAVADSQSWLIARMVPGSHPFAELEAALLRSVIDGPDSLEDQLQDDSSGLLRAVLRILPDDDGRIVIVIDQFEELFTLVDSDELRNRFLSNLVTALDDAHGRVSVVITLRADFYGKPLNHPEFGARLSGSVVNITNLNSEELEAAAVQPAATVGVDLEPALLGQLIADVGNQPGALPLFQYSLTELFDRRAGNTLRVDDYREMGGVQGALSRRADDLYEGLDQTQKLAAKQLFLRLVNVSQQDERTRRRVQASEILELDVDVVAMQHVIGRFGKHRLLSFDADHLTGAPTVEVAHEALLVSWPELRGWIDESREDLRRHASFTLARDEWELAGRNPDYLPTGSRLSEFEEWSTRSALALTTTEKQFIDAATARRDEELVAETQRQKQESDMARRARRRLWGVVAAICALAAVGGFFLFAALTETTPKRVAFFGYENDDGWNQNLAAGLDRIEREYEVVRENVAPTFDVREDFRTTAEGGADLIVTDSLPSLAAKEVFLEFPDTKFVVVDGTVASANTASVKFANEEGAFLAGAAAALKSETGIVGYVGGLRAIVDDFRAGFEAGALHVNPEVQVLSTYVEEDFGGAVGNFVGAFVRPDLGHALAGHLYDMGADVVFHAAGFSGFGVFEAAAEKSDETGQHRWAIGVDNDQWLVVEPRTQPHILTSMIKRGDVATYQVTAEFLEGRFLAGTRRMGLSDGALELASSGDGMTAAMRVEIAQISHEIIDGTLIVPSETKTETLVLHPLPPQFDAAFADLGPEEILTYFDWLKGKYLANTEASCFLQGNMTTCGQLMIDHLDEWLTEA